MPEIVFNKRNKVYFGSQEIKKIYCGSALVWEGVKKVTGKFLNGLPLGTTVFTKSLPSDVNVKTVKAVEVKGVIYPLTYTSGTNAGAFYKSEKTVPYAETVTIYYD